MRTRKGEDLGTMSVDEFIAILEKAIAERGRFGMENWSSDAIIEEEHVITVHPLTTRFVQTKSG